MNIRIIGAVFIVIGCGCFGFLMAASYRKEINTLREMIYILDYMQCELQYRQTPLPQLCRQAAEHASGQLRKLFLTLTYELEDRIYPDVSHCVSIAISKNQGAPKTLLRHFTRLGKDLGRYDVEGQIKGLEAARQDCRRSLKNLSANEDVKLRNYKTLGLCAGAALAILFV